MLDKLKTLFTNGVDVKKENANKCVLIVEDSEIDRKVVEEIVSKQGYRHIAAENGRIGLQKAFEEKPDLIILDCEMPELGGVETCKQLKQNQETKDIPVVFLTSVDMPKNIIDCFESDAENYLSKPVSSKVLITEINTILSRPSV